jgi:transposase InsO family protein
VLKSPPRSPKANAICERAIGTIRRDYLDWLIPMSELHLRLVLNVWVTHYNGAHPHMALGPGVPDPPLATVRASTQLSWHQIGGRLVLRVKSILAGLHHEYSLAPALG